MCYDDKGTIRREDCGTRSKGDVRVADSLGVRRGVYDERVT